MTAKTEDINVRTRKVDLFAVVTARPRLETWPISTLRVESTRFFILQTLPHTSSGQENLCRGYCLFCANRTRWRKPSSKIKKVRESFFQLQQNNKYLSTLKRPAEAKECWNFKTSVEV